MPNHTLARSHDLLLGELTEFLSIPSISALPNHAPDCRKAAEWLLADLRRLGCPVATLIEGDGQPVVWAESPPVPGAPTLLIYGHYDVQPVDPLDEWVTPPFTPTVRDGKLFARGSADDKGQVFCLLRAYEALCDTTGHPPLNVHFIFEGEEESGGHVIYDLLKREPERTRCTPRCAACATPRYRCALCGGTSTRELMAVSRQTRSRHWCICSMI